MSSEYCNRDKKANQILVHEFNISWPQHNAPRTFRHNEDRVDIHSAAINAGRARTYTWKKVDQKQKPLAELIGDTHLPVN
jgi:hypothetical protein